MSRGESSSLKQKRKFHAMVRDIAKQVKWDGSYLSDKEWKFRIFAGFYGQEYVPNIFYDPSIHFSREFIITNNERARDIAMSGDISMAALITQLYAFGAIKGVEWSDPEWKAMREQDAAEAAAHG